MKKNIFLFRLQKIFFSLTILILPTQLGRHFWPSFSYVSGIRVDYLSPTFYVTDVLIAILCALWICSKFLVFKSQINTKIPSNKRFRFFNFGYWNLVIGIYMVIICVGIGFSKSPLAGLYGLVKLLEFGFFGWYIARCIKNKKDFISVILLFSIGICFESFLAIAQFINQTSIGGVFYFFGERTFFQSTPGIAIASLQGHLVLRPYGTFSHPNVLAGYLLIAMTIILFSFQLQSFNKYFSSKKLFFAVVILSGTIAIFLTMSRIAILLWVVLMLLFALKYLNRKNPWQILLGMFICIVVGVFLLSPLHGRFSDFRLTDEAFVVRERLLQASLAMGEKNPLIGVGLNNFLPNLPFVLQATNGSFFSYLQPVHNIYMIVFTETGILGFCFFAWFLFRTWKKLLVENIKNKNPFIFYPFIIILVLGFFDHYFLTLQQGQLLFACVLGFCWSKIIG